MTARPQTLEELAIENGYAQLGAPFVEDRLPTPLPKPYLVAYNPEVAELLGIARGEEQRPQFLAVAAGNALLRGSAPTAAVYAGHQFGSYVQQLGDGRAITLGTVRAQAGDLFEWQLKGAGETAFSRFGDGRAVLRSTIREYLCSEAMHHLGIPTTRALAIVGSDEPVFREKQETAAVLSRIAPSHVRFGTFEYFHYTQQPNAVRSVAEHVIGLFFPEAAAKAPPTRYTRFFADVVRRTATLIAHWQAVGFMHGVMNTDNMSILGLTLDYGPFGFMEAYDPGHVCNHTDVSGRYAFEMQPGIAKWNCHALAAALQSLVDRETAETILGTFDAIFRDAYRARMKTKLGLMAEHDGDTALIVDMLALLAANRVDYSHFFRRLSRLGRMSTPVDDEMAALFKDRDGWYAWQNRYRTRLALETASEDERATRMLGANPGIVLRNYLAQEVIDAAEQRDFSPLAQLHAALQEPFAEARDHERFAAPPPPWAAKLAVSCSS